MVIEYIMARCTIGNLLYTAELLIVISIFLTLFFFWKKRGDRNAFLVFLITGLWNSGVELFAQGFGIRINPETYLFNIFYVKFPFLCFVMGFFEGGILCLFAYHFIN